MIYRQNIEFEVKIDGLGKKSLKGTVMFLIYDRLFLQLIE